MFTSFRRHVRIMGQLLALLILLSTTLGLSAADWVKVQDDNGKLCGKGLAPDSIKGKRCGISGMVLLPPENGRTRFLVVHDSYGRIDEPRLGILTTSSNPVNYHPLWPTWDYLPSDLEAISSLPGSSEQFLALSSNGQLFSLKVSGDIVTAQREFTLTKFMPPPLPKPKVEIEGLSVQELGGQIVIVWGHRGGDMQPGTEQPGILYCGLLDLKNKQVLGIKKTPIDVKFPTPNDPHTRPIADLRVDANGVVWASATHDPGLSTLGDIGPFKSAVYNLGVLRVSKTSDEKWRVEFDQNPALTRLWAFERKVEAIELVPGPDGGIAFGAEDEDKGGWFYFR